MKVKLAIIVVLLTIMIFCCDTGLANGGSGNRHPVAVLKAKPAVVKLGNSVRLDGSTSYDPDGSIVKCEWDFYYDGQTFAPDYNETPGDKKVSYTYDNDGNYVAALRVTDNKGATSNIAACTIEVKEDIEYASQEPYATSFESGQEDYSLINWQYNPSYFINMGTGHFQGNYYQYISMVNNGCTQDCNVSIKRDFTVDESKSRRRYVRFSCIPSQKSFVNILDDGDKVASIYFAPTGFIYALDNGFYANTNVNYAGDMNQARYFLEQSPSGDPNYTYENTWIKFEIIIDWENCTYSVFWSRWDGAEYRTDEAIMKNIEFDNSYLGYTDIEFRKDGESDDSFELNRLSVSDNFSGGGVIGEDEDIFISLPISDTINPLKGKCEIIGSIWYEEIGRYKVKYCPADSDPANEADWIEIGQGWDIINNGLLGTWDTSGLKNGDYFLRLEIYNDLGVLHSKKIVSKTKSYNRGEFQKEVKIPYSVYTKLQGGTFNYEDKPDIVIDWPGQFPFELKRVYNSNRAAYIVPFFGGWTFGHDIKLYEDCTFEWITGEYDVPIADANGLGIGKIWLMNSGSSSLYLGQIDPNDNRCVIYKSALTNDYIVRTSNYHSDIPLPRFSVSYTYYGRDGIEIAFNRLDGNGNPYKYNLNYTPYAGEGAVDWSVTVGATEKRDRFANALNYEWHYEEDSPLYITEITNNRTNAYVQFEVYEELPLYHKAFLKIRDDEQPDVNVMTVTYKFGFLGWPYGYFPEDHIIERCADRMLVKPQNPSSPVPNELVYKEHRVYAYQWLSNPQRWLLSANPDGCIYCEEGTFQTFYSYSDGKVARKAVKVPQVGYHGVVTDVTYSYDANNNLITTNGFRDGDPEHLLGGVHKRVITVQNSDGAVLSEKTRTYSKGYMDTDSLDYYLAYRLSGGGFVDINQSYKDANFPTKPTMIVEHFDNDGDGVYDGNSRTTTMEYDRFGNLTERRGYIDETYFTATQWEFHPLYDFPIRQTAWQGYCYDSGGTTIPSGKKIETLYIHGDADGTVNGEGKFLVQKKELLDDSIEDVWAVTYYTYYDTGLVKSQTDPGGSITFFEYDENGFTSKVWKGATLNAGYPVGSPQERYYYDEIGQCILRADALGAVIKDVYNGLGRMEITRKYRDVDAMSRADFNPDVYDDNFDSEKQFLYYNPYSRFNWTSDSIEEDGYIPFAGVLDGYLPYVKEILDTGGTIRRRHNYGFHATPPTAFVYDDNSIMRQRVHLDMTTPLTIEYIPRVLYNSFYWDPFEVYVAPYNDDPNDVRCLQDSFKGGRRQVVYHDCMDRQVQQIWQEYDVLNGEFVLLNKKHQYTGYYGDGNKKFEMTYKANSWKDIYGKVAKTPEKHTEFLYDSLGRLIKQIDRNTNAPDDVNSLTDPNRITTFGYDAAGNKIYIIDPNGNCLFTDYDNANRKTKEYFATKAIMDTVDANYLDYQATRPNAVLKQEVEYMADGKVAFVKMYDTNGIAILSQKVFDYDTRGRISRVIEQITVDTNAITNYYYADTTSASLLGPSGDENYHIQIVDAESQSTYIQLNEYGMTKKILYPSGDYEQTEYTNEYGFKYILPYKKTVWNNDGDPCTIQYEYDSYGKVSKIIYPDGYLEYEYGPRCFGKYGRVEKVKDYRNSDDRLGSLGNEYKYTYDCLDRITAYNDSDFVINYDYRASDSQKNRISVVLASDTNQIIYDVNYAYNLLGQMERVYDPCILDVNIASFQYDDNGNRKQLKYWLIGEINDVNYAIDYSYNINNNLTGITAGTPEGEPNYTFNASAAGALDGLGRLKSAQETISYPAQANRSHTSNFAYNMQSSLKTASITDVNGAMWRASYTYKKDGNISMRTGSSLKTYRYDTTPDNGTYFDSDIMTKAGGDDLTWDENGRLIGKESMLIAHFYEYNWDGKLRRTAGEYGFIELKYDPMGNRVYKSLNAEDAKRYIVDITGGLPVILCEIDPSTSSVTNKYYYANAQILRQDNAEGSFYYVHDRLGSVRLVISSVGSGSSVANSYTYNPFGEMFTSECDESVYNPFKFTGQWYDSETGHYYLRARQYDPALMRFTAMDPVKGKQDEPLTLHLYLYCQNNPVNWIDPGGKSRIDAILTGFALYNHGIELATYAAASGNWKFFDLAKMTFEFMPIGMAMATINPLPNLVGRIYHIAQVHTAILEGLTQVTGMSYAEGFAMDPMVFINYAVGMHLVQSSLGISWDDMRAFGDWHSAW